MRDRFKSRVLLRRGGRLRDGDGDVGRNLPTALRVKINGRAFESEAGLTILRALRSAGDDVPTLCSDERLKPCGNCRLCLVEVKGLGRPVTACNTPLADGMEIETQTARLERARRMILRMSARNYPAEAVGLFPEKKFHRYVREYGVESDLLDVSDSSLVDDSHPYIRVDMSRCIDCRRCVRAAPP